ncbi:MAG: RNA 3'-phosphate cyclase [Methylobacter sp.]|nr:MAG: RNA 3'-phosphate cyclase [Methylobacter sp.]PPD02607.1 MAG: RNA 3'-phosphate cyclase [Methylobacter sp.]
MTLLIDGAFGEGGGQILRSALTLAMCTGTPIRIANIRANRKKSGLLRQHLTAVEAAAAICGAETEGANLNSTELSFIPGSIKSGDYRFSIGTAGSCTLVLQTVLPALLKANQDSNIMVSGGTHNSMSPPFHFLQRAFVPLLQKMGAKVELELNRFGFYPAGGGQITAKISAGSQLRPLHLVNRGARLKAYAESFSAGLPSHIAERELAEVKMRMSWSEDQLLLRAINPKQGPGNVLLITLEHETVTEVFTGFAELGVAAESVAKGAVLAAQKYITGNAAVGTFLTDQFLLPMALAGGGSFTATDWSQHASTNAHVIEQFLPVKISAQKIGKGMVTVKVLSNT